MPRKSASVRSRPSSVLMRKSGAAAPHPQRATDRRDGIERPQVERIARGCTCGHRELVLVFAQQTSPAARICRRRFVERNARGVVTRLEVERHRKRPSSRISTPKATGRSTLAFLGTISALRIIHTSVRGSTIRPVTSRPPVPILRSKDWPLSTSIVARTTGQMRRFTPFGTYWARVSRPGRTRVSSKRPSEPVVT